MNFKKIALGGFSQATDEELLVRSNVVVQAMTGSAYFPDSGAQLDEVAVALKDYQDKLAVCRRTGSPENAAVKNTARGLLIDAMQQLCFYVNKAAKGNLEMLLHSGFELSRHPRAGEAPEMVNGIRLRDGKQSGQLRLDFANQPRILLYEYRYAVEENGEPGAWSEPLLTTSSRANILAPLQPFTRCYIQVRAVNGFGKSEWSEAVSHIPR